MQPVGSNQAWQKPLRPLLVSLEFLAKFGCQHSIFSLRAPLETNHHCDDSDQNCSMLCRLAIRAAKFRPEADFVSRAVGEKPTTAEFHRREKTRGH